MTDYAGRFAYNLQNGTAGGLPLLLRTAVASKVPARSDCRIESVGSGSAEIGKPGVVVVLAQPVHLVLGHAELKILWQLDAQPAGALKRNPRHRSRVFELRHVVAKRKCGREENEGVARECLPERLQLQVSAQKVARVCIASGAGAAGAFYDRRGRRATAQVRLVVRWCEGKIRVAAHPVVREEGAAFPGAPGRGPGGWIRRRSRRGERNNSCNVLREARHARKGQKRRQQQHNLSDSIFQRNSPFQYSCALQGAHAPLARQISAPSGTPALWRLRLEPTPDSGGFHPSLYKFGRAALGPRVVGLGETHALIEWRMIVEPEFNGRRGIRFLEVHFAQDLEGMRGHHRSIRHQTVNHFEAVLVGLMLQVPAIRI